jgi:hypothetical protein
LSAVTATAEASGHAAATIRRNDSDDAEDKNNNPDEDAHAKIAAAATTARITPGCPNGSNGARRHGGNKIVPPDHDRGGTAAVAAD